MKVPLVALMLLLLQASFITGLVCSYFLAGWRVALGVQCLFGIILIVGMLFLPETPRYVYVVMHHISSEPIPFMRIGY